MASAANYETCLLALEDGTVFRGRRFGAAGTRTGEVVFNTALTGYQEILTDPSYCGQIVTMTYPHIGNYGINDADVESVSPQVAGFVVRELARRPSNFRATRPLDEYLAAHGVIGIEGIDTRALTRRIRVEGAMRGVLTTEASDPAACVELARRSPSMVGADLVREVAPSGWSTWSEGLNSAFLPTRNCQNVRLGEASHPSRLGEASHPAANHPTRRGAASHPVASHPSAAMHHVVAIDCGMKRNILRHLVDAGARVTVAPPNASAAEILERRPNGVFVSNGPGDPAAVHYAVELLRSLIGKTPIFGICLGHQLIGLALGAKSFKLKFGHRGANQPVLNTATGRVEITSQNHGFAIDAGSLTCCGASVTHLNLNDRTLEGFVDANRALLAVQYHPEASPGPHDATYLFDCFTAMMQTGRAPTAEQMAEAQAALGRRVQGSVFSVQE